MSSDYDRKRRRPHQVFAAGDDKTLILSGDAAQVDYEDTTPVWKQEVTDDRGRKRLHGAFTGGFSAGYFNTVGSAQGWTPSTFVSSRSNRFKPVENKAVQYMDEEDLAEIEADRQLRLRKEAENKEADPPQEDTGYRPSGEHVTQKSNADAPAQVKPRLAAPTGGAKALSLMYDDEDVDGFDIGPKISYDKTLMKRKKTSSAAAQHKFQARRFKNPEPEPEVLEHRQHARSPSPQKVVPVERLPMLPSFGDGSGGSTSDQSFIHPDRLAQSDHKTQGTPIPPWRQESSHRANDAPKVPPWRQNESLAKVIPELGQATAQAALESTFTPYSADAGKHMRYRMYLEIEAHNAKDDAGKVKTHSKDIDMDDDTWTAELREFRTAALMYRPLSGAMSKKFVSSVPDASTAKETSISESIQLKAAKEGRYGHLTRTVSDWTPTKLLLKRFDIDSKSFSTDDRKSNSQNSRQERKANVDQRRAEVEDLMAKAMGGKSKFVSSASI